MMAITNGNSNNYKITEVLSKRDVYPLVLTFQNGLLQKTGNVDIQGGIYSSNTPGKHQKNAVVAIENMLYVGQESYNNICRNLIVTRNRKTGAVKLIEVGNAKLKAIPEQERVMDEEIKDSQDTTDARTQLGEAFGSKRQKRILEQSKKMKVDMDTMKEQLENTVNKKQIDVLEMTQLDLDPIEAMEKYAPPINREASTVDDVHKISDFLSDDLLANLQDTAKSVLEDETFEIDLSDYIANEIYLLRKSEKSDKINMCCLLLYADCIARYLKESYKKVCGLNYVLCSYSEPLNTLVFTNFSMHSDKGRTRPQSLKDKAICYLIALLLTTGNYVIEDAKKLSQAVSATVPKLTQMAKVAGAHIVNDGSRTTIVLKLPLAAPPIAMKGKRKR